MTDRPIPPLPAKLRPARSLEGEAARREASPAHFLPTGTPPPPDLAEVVVDRDGRPWTARVLGRSARRGGRSAPLLLLGFWDCADPGAPHALEALVPGRTLSELGQECLEEALARATPPPPSGRRKPFFDGLGQGRRGGPVPQEG
jgi:hypothetical protein